MLYLIIIMMKLPIIARAMISTNILTQSFLGGLLYPLILVHLSVLIFRPFLAAPGVVGVDLTAAP